MAGGLRHKLSLLSRLIISHNSKSVLHEDMNPTGSVREPIGCFGPSEKPGEGGPPRPRLYAGQSSCVPGTCPGVRAILTSHWWRHKNWPREIIIIFTSALQVQTNHGWASPELCFPRINLSVIPSSQSRARYKKHRNRNPVWEKYCGQGRIV